MSGTLQRLEILLIGLVLLIAGALVAILMIMRPATPSIYVQATPLPMPTRIPSTAPTAIPTHAPITTVVPTTIPAPRAIRPSRPDLALATALWPVLLLALGMVGLLLATRHFRRRRMGYMNQNVGQLLATADVETRASNVRVMRELAAQGVLTDELAAAAGINLAKPTRGVWLRLPRLAPLRIAVPRLAAVHLPQFMTLARRPLRSTRHDVPPSAAIPALAVIVETPAPVAPIAPTATDALAPTAIGLGLAPPVTPARTLPLVALHDVLATQTVELPELEPTAMRADAFTAGQSWTAEDRALAVAATLAEVWAAERLQSPILALDARSGKGDGPILVTIDAHPHEEDTLLDLPKLLTVRQTAWRVTWRRELLEITVPADGAPPPSGGPLIAPILTHGHGGATTRFFPLAAWRHLGLYGAEALGALHALVGSLLYSHPPAQLALAILDHGEIAPLYRNVPHLVTLPDTPHGTLDMLAQAIRRGAPPAARPLLLVVVDSGDDELKQLTGIAARLQARPATPLHLIVVQTHPRSAGRELYAQLPALILSGGSGPTTLLPGQGEWPKRGLARLIGRGMHVAGRAIALDEVVIVQTLAALHQAEMDLPPVLWDTTDLSLAASASTALVTATQIPNDSESAPPELDAAERKRRITDAIVRRRQALMDAQVVAAPVVIDEPALVAAAIATPIVAMDDSTSATPAHTEPMLASELTSLDMPEIVDVALPRADVTLDAPTSCADIAPTTRAGLFRHSRETGAASALDVSTFEPRPRPPSTAPLSIAVPESPSDAAPIQELENGWPIGPAPLGRVAMADIVSRVVATPAIVAGLPSEQGVTKNRLAEVFTGIPRAQAKELAEILMVWFDQAGLLVEPTRPGRLRHPRALITPNLPEIAGRLNATPCPDKATVRALWTESGEERN